MPILLWPFPSGITPPTPTFPIALSGKTFVIDAKDGYFFGPNPNKNESCSLVFAVGPGLPMDHSPVLFTFTKPDGTIYTGIVSSGFVGSVDIRQIYTPFLPAFQYLVYNFGVGELGMTGTWQVSAIASMFFSLTYKFAVTDPVIDNIPPQGSDEEQ